MSKVTVTAGPCKFKTEITATKLDRKTVKLDIDTQCPHFKTLNDLIPQVDAYKELFGKFGEGEICEATKTLSKHPSCPVACAILKAVEVEAGLALPIAPEFTMEK